MLVLSKYRVPWIRRLQLPEEAPPERQLPHYVHWLRVSAHSSMRCNDARKRSRGKLALIADKRHVTSIANDRLSHKVGSNVRFISHLY